MDKKTFVVVLLIASIVISSITVIMVVVGMPDSDFTIPTQNYIIKEQISKEPPSSGGVTFTLAGGG